MKRWLIALLSALAMTVSAGAMAQASVPGFYVGLDVGQADRGNEDDTAFKVFGGYQFHRNVAAEIGYARLLDKGGVEVNALEVVAVGMFPVANQLSILAKLGFANVSEKTPGRDDDNTELTYGVGVQYDFNRNLGARAQWQRYDTDQEVDLISIGVVYRF